MTRHATYATMLLGLLILLMLAALAVGSSMMPVQRVIAAAFGQGNRTDTLIVWELRMPRMLLAALSGAALAVAGVLLQRTARNPLAAPSVLGIVDGAALGVVLFLALLSDPANAFSVPIYWQPVAAITGAICFAFAVALLWWREMHLPMRLILYGVALAAFANAMVVLMIISGPVYLASQALIWLAGSVHQAEWRDVAILASIVASLLPLIMLSLRDLDQMCLDDQSSASTGLSVIRSRGRTLVLSVILTAAAVSVVGGIGFVGLIAPHAARLLFGTSARLVLSGAAILGAIMVLAADLLVRLAFQPLEVPTGAITALIGAPYFLYILIRQGRTHE